MATRLPAAVMTVSLVSLLVATLVGVTTGRDLGNDLTDERLLAMRTSSAGDIEGQMRSWRRTAAALATSPQAVVAVDEFAAGHAELLDTPPDELADQVEAVVAAYQKAYVEPFAQAGRDLDLRDILAESPAAIYLQNLYAVDLGVLEEPASLVDAGDGSAWSEVHAGVHPVYRDVVDRLDLFDLFLIEPESGVVVYSVNKRPGFATSLDLGPFSGSELAELFDQVRRDPGAGAVASDIASYDPALFTPVGTVGAPIMDGDRLAGVLVLMYTSAKLTALTTADGDWDGSGFPPTGESFIIGADGTTRTDPRTFLESPEDHLDASAAAGNLTPRQRVIIEEAGTTVLTQTADDATADAGIEGDTEIERRSTMTGLEAFSTVERLDVEDVEWYMVSEVEVGAAEGDLDDFVELLVIGAAIFIIALAFLAVGWAARIVRPVRAISERLQIRGADLGPIEISPRSPIEFRGLAESFESMSQALVEQQEQIAEAREERLDLLRRMLPPAVAERVAAGDVQNIEEVPQASVVVVVVLGLGDLVGVEGRASGRDLVEQLHGELDDLAERHGLERVKVVGDAYFAACGHARPYIDHAPRAAAFAADARDAVHDIGEVTGVGLDAAVGVHTGPVVVGVTGGSRFLYDVWGESVSVAHHLARSAAAQQILVSEAVRGLLPDTVEVRQVGRSDDTGASDGSVWSIGPAGGEVLS